MKGSDPSPPATAARIASVNALDIISPQLTPLAEEPFYRPVNQEDRLFEAAFQRRLPVLLKGPTGCGKTRFVEYMAWKLKRPLVTVACHEDLTASDLVGRYLIVGGQTVWMEGPLSAAVRNGAICYLDEVVEARKDTMVLIHPLADSRRVLPVEKRGEWVHAAEGFMLVISYNPGYQSVLKELKQSTRQRFIALDFDYPAPALEAEIVMHETGIAADVADKLVKFAGMTRNLRGSGLDEGASTRLLVHAGNLIAAGIEPAQACRAAIAQAVTDDAQMLRAVHELFSSVF
jgi:nitric oxide reductase NorQ protein